MGKGFGDTQIMCIINACLTKDYGVIASDSAEWNPNTKTMTFEKPKLMWVGGKHLMTFIGSNLFLTNLDLSKLSLSFDCLCVYLTEFLQGINDSVQETFKGLVTDENEYPAKFCLFLLGVHNGNPALAQFNSFINFKPHFLWSDDGIKFASIYYGEDNPDKQEIFLKTTEFMEEIARNYSGRYGGQISHGLAGEILTRGIYRKADLEEQIGDKVKYAGGVVTVARIDSGGHIYAPSNLISI